ncbi:MAG TPA: CAP domain-containing protein [Solimonas sp.]|nr:CAP domain-containing protein [Solimonas sp.]
MRAGILTTCAVLALGAALAAEPLVESDASGDADLAPLPLSRSLQPVYPKFPPMDPEAEPADYAGMVAAHNTWRRQVGVPELRGWSHHAADLAQDWANQLATEGCQMRHSTNPARKAAYGENIYRYWRTSRYEPWKRDSRFVVDAWGSEKGWYNPQENTCAPPEGGTCGHYTAVVWDRTYLVGCGRAFCGDSEVWVCNYYPRGNYYEMRPFRMLAAADSGGPDLPDPPALQPAPAVQAPTVVNPKPAPPPDDLFGEPPAHDPMLPD